jgi:hypothetical protein
MPTTVTSIITIIIIIIITITITIVQTGLFWTHSVPVRLWVLLWAPALLAIGHIPTLKYLGIQLFLVPLPSSVTSALCLPA